MNNVTFGSLVVRYGIHHNLLCQSKPLADAIDSFVMYQEENGHAVTGHVITFFKSYFNEYKHFPDPFFNCIFQFKLLNDLEVNCANDIEVPKTLGDMFESLAGAVFLDSEMSFDITWKVFYRLMKHDIGTLLIR